MVAGAAETHRQIIVETSNSSGFFNDFHADCLHDGDDDDGNRDGDGVATIAIVMMAIMMMLDGDNGGDYVCVLPSTSPGRPHC